MRKSEMFDINKIESEECISSDVAHCYHQERDWTCSVACIRTILSGFCPVQPEKYYIDKYNLEKGPHYSPDIKKRGMFDGLDVVYGCDISDKSIDFILGLLKKGYHLMVESMYNYAHWMVLLGYYVMSDKDIEKRKLLLYDPYYDELRLINADEFIGMWQDGDYRENGIVQDFIAVKLDH